jgi:hypothetical protein
MARAKAVLFNLEETSMGVVPNESEWTAFRDAASVALHENEATLQAFRQKVATLFRSILEGQGPFNRRPSVSLRLICRGEPPAKLVVHPGWNSAAKTVDPDWSQCELLQEALDIIKGQRVKVFGWLVTFGVGADRVFLGGIHRTAEADIHRAIETMQDFLDDDGAVLARSHGNCCCCGRHLADELSRSRGIGPECNRRIPFFAVRDAGWNSIVVPEPGAA